MSAKSKELDFITKIVIFVITFLVIFTVVMTLLFINYQAVPDTLIQMVFTVFGLELLATMFKKCLDKWVGGTPIEESDSSGEYFETII